MQRKRILLWTVCVLLAAAAGAEAAGEQKFNIELEIGPVWQSRNDARVPNETGTKFSLRDIQGSGPFASGRIQMDYALNPRHEFRFLAAPLVISETGKLGRSVFFAGESFEPGPQVRAVYKFNSYRLTYRYRIYEGDRWTWKLGVTGKVRDAKIELMDGTTSAVDEDLGFVPLVHLDGEYRFAPKWKLNLNIDGLGAPQGRALDAALKLKYDLSKNWTVAVGYRTLEGGADVDSVYTFAWLHYAAASIAWHF